jgi:hypothetical protein
MPKEQEPGMEKENAETKEVLFFFSHCFCSWTCGNEQRS